MNNDNVSLHNHPVSRSLTSVITGMFHLNILNVKFAIARQLHLLVGFALVVAVIIRFVAQLRKVKAEPLPDDVRIRCSRDVAFDLHVVADIHAQIVQGNRHVEVNLRNKSITLCRARSFGNSMKCVVKFVNRQHVVFVGVVVQQHIHECAIGVVCDVMHVHGVPHQSQFIALYQAVVVLIVVRENNRHEIVHAMNGHIVVAMLKVNHVLVVKEKQIVFHDRVFIAGACWILKQTLAHVADVNRPATHTTVSIQFAKVVVKLSIAAAKSTLSLVVNHALPLTHAKRHIRGADGAFHSFGAVVNQARI